MMGSILSDTQNLKASATDADREALKALSELGGVTDIDSFFKDMYKASISYSGMTDEEIFFSDYKEYETEGVKYCIGTVFAYDEKSAQDLAERLKKLLPGAVKSRKMDVGFANISIFHDDLAVTYLVPADETAAKAVEAAFSDKAGFDGTSYIFRPGVARKKVLVPAFNEVLADTEIWEVP
jgi:manganese-dependent inorganic pyrophosphatase